MGILDFVKNLFVREAKREVNRQIEKKVDQIADDYVDKQLDKIEKENGFKSEGYGRERLNSYEKEAERVRNFNIPNDYKDFPPFGVPNDSFEKNENGYKRFTMIFNVYNKDRLMAYKSYIESSFGYKKATDIRWEKGKTYIIIDDSGDGLTIVFHINK